jgi:phosphoglycerate dehydrogenase-like enzyme
VDRHCVLVTVPQPLRGRILTPAALARLQIWADVTMNQDGRNWTADELAVRLPGVDALITGWGIVQLSAAVLAKADRLRIVAHAAGSVKGFVTDAVFSRGIIVTHAASRIAASVAEFSLLAVLMGLRRAQDFDRQMKTGIPWPNSADVPTFEIAGRKVGLLGMGYVGRHAAALFRAVGAEVWAYDPYLSRERADELGVHKADLDDLLRTCPVISVHLPVTDETHHLLGVRELALVQDGAVFVNTARSWVVDQEALLHELVSGRIWAAIDVFDSEPLPAEHPLRQIPNVLLSPHIAGLTLDSYQGLMALMIEELERFFEGHPLRFAVRREMLATMA